MLRQREKNAMVSWECQEELFRQEVENADNLLLNYRLMRKCMGDKKKFCPDVQPGLPFCRNCTGSGAAVGSGQDSCEYAACPAESVVNACCVLWLENGTFVGR